MQISTRQEDFLIDTLSLRDDLQILNEVFTDPNILKVIPHEILVFHLLRL